MNAALSCALRTPNAPGAIAIIELTGDLESAAPDLDFQIPGVGAFRHEMICGVDKGVVARWRNDELHLMPHGGAHITRRILEALESSGVQRTSSENFPTAASDDMVEQLMLSALARARSPRAIDQLMRQPSRWRDWDGAQPTPDQVDAVSRELNRLVDPPLVIALGATNIGKSTLVNALARRSVALVDDQPGVTRDHVGVTLDLDGLSVRWLDTPGLRTAGDNRDPVEEEALALTRDLLPRADLIILCADQSTSFDHPAVLIEEIDAPVLRLGLRRDLGAVPEAEFEIALCEHSPDDLTPLARRIRSLLVSDAALSWQGPWRFSDSISPPPAR